MQVGLKQWHIDKTKYIMQDDGYNCGPIACLVALMDLFLPCEKTIIIVLSNYRKFVIQKPQRSVGSGSMCPLC